MLAIVNGGLCFAFALCSPSFKRASFKRAGKGWAKMCCCAERLRFTSPRFAALRVTKLYYLTCAHRIASHRKDMYPCVALAPDILMSCIEDAGVARCEERAWCGPRGRVLVFANKFV